MASLLPYPKIFLKLLTFISLGLQKKKKEFLPFILLFC